MNSLKNSALLRFIYFVIAFIVTFPTAGQLMLQGKIIDVQTNKGVAYANVSIMHSAAGTATNEDGDFLIAIPSYLITENLKVSCIGYITQFLSIDSLLALPDKNVIISLKSHEVLLEEVVIKERYLDPAALLKEAIAAVPENYLKTPFNMELYSTMKLVDSSELYYQVESILLAYRKGYINGAENISKILQKRTTGKSPLYPNQVQKKTNLFPYYPGPDIFLSDRIGQGAKDGWTIFNPSVFKKLHFKYDGISGFDRDTVCAIKYGLKKNFDNEKSKYHGTVYIAVNNLAFVRHTSGLGTDRYDIIYKKYTGKYFPYLIRTETPVKYVKMYQLIHEVVLRSIKTDNTEVVEFIPDNWFPEDVAYNKEYWDSNYPVKNKNQ